MSVSIHKIKENKKDSTLSFIQQAYDEGKMQMQSYYRQWALQLAWVRGHQNTDIDPDTKAWKRPIKDSWRSRLVSNLMLPLVRRNVSRLVHPNLTWDVLPATPDEEDIEIAWAPGSFEIPLIAKKLAQSKKYDAVICLGAVIRGGTPHFEYIAAEVSKGIARVSLETGLPVIYGIITADTLEQAIERAGTKEGNAGFKAAENAL